MERQAESGWWKAADGYWYPPEARPGNPWHGPARGPHGEDPPGPGWWLASDYQWYPPDARPGEVWSDPVAVVPGQPVRPSGPRHSGPRDPRPRGYTPRSVSPGAMGNSAPATPDQRSGRGTADAGIDAGVTVIKGLIVVFVGMLLVAVTQNLSGDWRNLAFVGWLPIIGGFAYSAFGAVAFARMVTRR